MLDYFALGLLIFVFISFFYGVIAISVNMSGALIAKIEAGTLPSGL